VTIAMCVIVPEGVILGADSTVSSSPGHGRFHYFNNNQKLFEIGEGSTTALLTWGLAAFGDVSYRTLIANMTDTFGERPTSSVSDMASRWVEIAWETYKKIFDNEIEEYKELERLLPYGLATGNTKGRARTQEEENRLNYLSNVLFAGFCIAGYVLPDRTPQAYKIEFSPNLRTAPNPVRVPSIDLWGAPDFIVRLLNGSDPQLKKLVMDSKHWVGSELQLETVLNATSVTPPLSMPLRDAIDFVHFCIYATIKVLKFSNFNQICGGPIELAVISTDRKFRWVKHKAWDSALVENL
jgi:hypothetical protein